MSSDFIPPTPAHGKLEKTGTAFVYTPNADFSGVDNFTYKITDGRGGTAVGNVAVTVKSIPIPPPTNKPPTAAADSVSTAQNKAITITFADLLKNDSDPDGDTLSVSSDFTIPAHGRLDKTATGFVYTPNAGYAGADSFTYTISDGRGASAKAAVNIVVVSPYIPPVNPPVTGGTYYENTPPTAADDSFSVSKGATLNFKDADLLRNDKDADGNSITIQSFTQPSHGTLIKTADGSFSYTPAQNYVGQDSFSYTISDGTSTGTAKVSISVLGSAGPEANDDAVIADGVTVIEAKTLLSNDVGINSWDRLTISRFTQPSHGILVDNGDETFAYTPASGYTGSDSFTYAVSDGRGGTDTATVNITVNTPYTPTTPDPPTPPDPPTGANQPPAAADDRFNITKDTSMVLKPADLLGNDSDPNKDPISITGIEQPYDGKLTDNQDGTATYTPNSGFIGEDSFAYTISDGRGGTAVGVVYVNVTSSKEPNPAENKAPVAADDIFATKQNTSLLIIKDTLLKNDSDPNGDTLSVSDMSQPSHGKLANNGTTLTYTPDNGFIGKDSFIYAIFDGKGSTASATVNIFINSVTDKTNSPDAVDDTVTTSQNVVLTISGQSLMSNDKDPLGNPLTIIGYTQTFNGSIADKGNSTYLYTPKTGFSGTDMFSYTVSNGKGGTDTAWVKITVASSSTRSADNVRRSAEPTKVEATASDIQKTAVSSDTSALNNSQTSDIVAPVNGSLTIEPIVIQTVSDDRSANVVKDGTPYQKETYTAVSGQKVFDAKADKNYQEWIRTAVYDRSDILAANYGGGDNAEIIRYQAYFKAKEDHNPGLWRDRDTSQSSEITTQESSKSDSRLVVKKEAGDQNADETGNRSLKSDAQNALPPLEIIDTLSQPGDMAMGFADQIHKASGCFDTERMDFLSRLGT